ncbi:MAG: MBL fold metallo-hydrolase [Actinomycetota bacterium]
MEITMLGTGSPIPDPNRAAPTALVKAGDTHLLLDAGRGVVMRMAAAGSMPPMLSAVLITHFHSDHIAALNDVITTHWVMTQEQATLRIFGPPGLADLVDRTLHMLEFDIGYRIAHHEELTEGPQIEVTELEPGDTFSVNDVTITTAATEHPPVFPTIGYRLEHDGTSVAMVGDTNPCDGVYELATGTDAYLQSVIRKDLVRQIPMEMIQDILDYHSDVVEAAQTAAKVGAKRLLLTHMVPAPPVDQYDEWIALAREHFDGEIVMGDDLTTVTI